MMSVLLLLLCGLFTYVVCIKETTISDKSQRYPQSMNDIPRREIIKVLNTGGRSPNGDFAKALSDLLIGNRTVPIKNYDLALWISAIVARNENPRNVRGIDLVKDLIHRVEGLYEPPPYLILTLCNCRAVNHHHLHKMVKYYSRVSNFTHSTGTDALLLMALACSASLPNAHKKQLDRFTEAMIDTANKIAASTRHGDIVTTSLVVQALTAYNIVVDTTFDFEEQEALDYLRQQSMAGNLVKEYYIGMALHSRRVPFLNLLNKHTHDTEMIVKKDIVVNLEIKSELAPGEDFAIRLIVPEKWNLFEVLLKASNWSARFQFGYTLKDGLPLISEVDSIVNDPEMGFYWMICSTSVRRGAFFATPSIYYPADKETVIIWYRSTDCPAPNTET